MKQYIRCQIPILPVRNMKESIDFYRDVLGFDVAWVWEDNGYAAVRCGEIEIYLDRQDSFATYRSHSYFFVDNADEMFALFQSRGVDIVKEIESKPWGVREFTFRDPNGHMFRVAHGEE